MPFAAAIFIVFAALINGIANACDSSASPAKSQGFKVQSMGVDAQGCVEAARMQWCNFYICWSRQTSWHLLLKIGQWQTAWHARTNTLSLNLASTASISAAASRSRLFKYEWISLFWDAVQPSQIDTAVFLTGAGCSGWASLWSMPNFQRILEKMHSAFLGGKS